MTAYALKTRRMVLRDMGKAGLAVLVLGTSACANSSSGDTVSPSGDDATTSPSGDVSDTTEAASMSTETEASTSTTAAPGAGFEWQRVDLGFVSAYILYRSGEAALVDTGVSDSETAIESALEEIGLGWDAVGHVIVTHEHPDHQGSLQGVLARAPDATWYAGQGDIPAITAPTEGLVVADGESVFDLEIIETPGHTDGHISVLDRAAGILVAGDALNGVDGGVAGANPDFSEDMDMANASVRKLAGFDYEVALFGHGEPVVQAASAAVSDLASSLG